MRPNCEDPGIIKDSVKIIASPTEFTSAVKRISYAVWLIARPERHGDSIFPSDVSRVYARVCTVYEQLKKWKLHAL